MSVLLLPQLVTNIKNKSVIIWSIISKHSNENKNVITA